MRWEEFQRLFLSAHRQGEHVAIVGQTGSGKSTLGLELCELLGSRKARDGRPARVAILATKPRDDTLRALQKRTGDWPVIKTWPPGFDQEHCIVWPRGGPPSQRVAKQRAVFRPLLDVIYTEGGQTVYIDEASTLEDTPPEGLGIPLGSFWREGRSLKLTVVGGTQRPRNVTRSMWSEPSWVFVFPPDDLDDLKRVAELSGMRERVMIAADRLGGHEFLCVMRQRNGRRDLIVSKVGA